MGGGINLPPYEKLGSVVKQIAPIMGDPGIFGGEYYEDNRKKQAFEVACDQWSGGKDGAYRLECSSAATSTSRWRTAASRR